MSKRKLKQLERDYHAMLNRWLTIDLNDAQYDRVEAEYQKARSAWKAGQGK